MVLKVHDETTERIPARSEGPFPIWLALLGLALAFGLFSFLNSAYFHITAVEVRGRVVVPHAEIMSRAGVYPGDNLLHVDLRQVAARVAAHPRVRHVHVRRRLPDTLHIIVQEHVPVALVPMTDEQGGADAEKGLDGRAGADGPFVAVNDVVQEVPLTEGEADGLPVVRVADSELLLPAVAAAAHMPVSLRERVAVIEVDADGAGIHIVARTRSGGVILFGDDDDLSRKGAIAASLMETADYAVVDVRFPRSPAVRPR